MKFYNISILNVKVGDMVSYEYLGMYFPEIVVDIDNKFITTKHYDFITPYHKTGLCYECDIYEIITKDHGGRIIKL
jgi:Zn/Cd-binding protein ZinT